MPTRRHRRSGRRRGGLTLAEVAITTWLFSILTALLFYVVSTGSRAFLASQSRHAAQSQLSRAANGLLGEIRLASPSATRFKRVPTPGSGDALWFLSPIDPDSGEPVRDPATGGLIPQRNILYYLIRPASPGHESLSRGVTCVVDSTTPDGDAVCGHKILVRKVIRKEPDPALPEQLLTDSEIDAYLTQPDGRDFSPMSAEIGTPGVDPGGMRVAGHQLLWFRVTSSTPEILNFDFRALRLAEIRNLSLGQHPFPVGPVTVQYETAARLENL